MNKFKNRKNDVLNTFLPEDQAMDAVEIQKGYEIAEGKTPKSQKTEPLKKEEQKQETRSRRFSLLITPTLFEELDERAKQEGRSTNNYINYILEKHLRG